MTEAAKQARRAYKREWARKNPDRVKQYNENYWNKKAASQSAEALSELEQGKTPPPHPCQ